MESHNLNFIVESNIPFIRGLLEPYGHVTYLPAAAFDADSVKDADALLVRTRTRCDEGLLHGSKVSYIGTATIGTDHIDMAYCSAHGIAVHNAPGCNAPAVAQYVLSSILHLVDRPVDQYTIGIVGVGNVGRTIEQWCRQLGIRVLVNDPPRQLSEGGDQWSSLDDIAAECDIVTFHPSLNETSRHLIDDSFIGKLKRKPIIINAARGPIADTQALIRGIDNGLIGHAVIDTWEGEPAISAALLDRAVIATPHIAGYSREGKVRATRMVLDSLSSHFGLPHIAMEETVPPGACASVTPQAIYDSYDPMTDTAALKASPAQFESLRNHYNLRPEVNL